jgi:hypothetical protein
MQTGASLTGRAFAQTGVLTLDSNIISTGACLTAPVSAPATALPEVKEKKVKVKSLPNTGGAPIRNEDFPLSLVIYGGIGAVALVLGVRAYIRTNKQ